MYRCMVSLRFLREKFGDLFVDVRDFCYLCIRFEIEILFY